MKCCLSIDSYRPVDISISLDLDLCVESTSPINLDLAREIPVHKSPSSLQITQKSCCFVLDLLIRHTMHVHFLRHAISFAEDEAILYLPASIVLSQCRIICTSSVIPLQMKLFSIKL